MSKITEVSRDAQVVAYGLFLTGRPQSLSFKRPHIIHPRTKAALDELTEGGFLERMDHHDAAMWRATEKLGMPMRDFPNLKIKVPTKADSFPITTE